MVNCIEKGATAQQQNGHFPATLKPILENIPKELRDKSQWVNWKLQRVAATDDTPPKKPFTKIPLNSTRGGKASTTNPRTWSTLATAADKYHRYSAHYALGTLQGIGFVLQDEQIGIDIDNCREPSGGQLDADAQRIIAKLNSYTEISPSGTGIRILVKGALPTGRRRKGKIEIYDHTSPRYLTITGHHLPGTPTSIEERTEAVAEVHAEYLGVDAEPVVEPQARHQECPDDLSVGEILEIATQAKNGDKFKALWAGDTSAYDHDHSRADQALASMLAFYLGPNEELIDELFRQSGLMRDKWERDDYRSATIEKACQQESFYEWGLDADLEAKACELVGASSPKTSPADAALSATDSKSNTLTPEECEALESAVKDQKAKEKAQKLTGIRFRRWSQLKQIAETQKEDWLWPGWIEFGSLAILTGLPFSGKSLLVAEMIAAIAKGSLFCDTHLAKCPIVMLDMENKERILVRRIQNALGTDEGEIEDLLFEIDRTSIQHLMPLDWTKIDDIIGVLEKQIGRLGRCFLIIDTLRSVFLKSTNDEDEMRDALYPLQAWALNRNVACLVLHHNNRAKDEYAGSAVIAGAADYLWTWHSDKNSGKASLTLPGTRGDAQDDLEFQFDKEKNRNIFMGHSEDVTRIKRQEDDLKDVAPVLAAVGLDWKKNSEVKHAIMATGDVSEATAKRIIIKAVQLGYVLEQGANKGKELKLSERGLAIHLPDEK